MAEIQRYIQGLRGIVRSALHPIRLHDVHAEEKDALEQIRVTRKFIFVTGMHRSGTTFLASQLGTLPSVSSFTDTPARMNEGQYLQRVIPIERDFGGMGLFGYHPRSRMLARSPSVASRIGVCLLKDWMGYVRFDSNVIIEKSPGNFRRSRLLASVFPNSCFIHVVRHPVATCLALKQFAPAAIGVKNRSLRELTRHWTHCQRLAIRDYEYLRGHGHTVLILAIEDLPHRGKEVSAAIADWTGTETPPELFTKSADPNINEKYQTTYNALSSSERTISRSCARMLRYFGYQENDLTHPPDFDDWLPGQE